MSTTEPTSPTARTRVRRVAHRGHCDRTTLHVIPDETYTRHIAFADEHSVYCIPTACWREGDHLYIHGSNGSRMLRLAGSGARVCVTVMHLNGLVLAYSAFSHSIDYRPAVIYSVFEIVPDTQKPAVFDTFVEVLAPGRSQQARPGNTKELAATTMLWILLDEAACKVCTGRPKDDAEDPESSVWAGVLPMVLLPSPLVVQVMSAETSNYVRE